MQTTLTKEEIQVTKRYVIKCLASLTIMKMQTKLEW